MTTDPLTISPSVYLFISRVHNVLCHALQQLLRLRGTTCSLQRQLPLPHSFSNLPDPSSPPLLSPFPAFHLSPAAVRIHALCPPHITSLSAAFIAEKNSLAQLTSLPHAPTHLFFSRLAARLSVVSPGASLVLIHPPGARLNLPSFPFSVSLCEPSDLCISHGIPCYRNSPHDVFRPITLASVEIPAHLLVQLPANQLAPILALARQSKLLADIRLALLAGDAHLLYLLRVHAHRLSLDKPNVALLRQTIAPVIPANLFSDNVLQSLTDQSFLVRPRFQLGGASSILVDAERVTDAISSIDASSYVVQSLSGNNITSDGLDQSTYVRECIGLILSVDDVFCGVSFFARNTSLTPLNGKPLSIATSSMCAHRNVCQIHMPSLEELRGDEVLSLLAKTPVAHIAVPNAPIQRQLIQFLQDKLQAQNVMSQVRRHTSLQDERSSDIRSFCTAGTLEQCPPRFVAIANNTATTATQIFELCFIRVSDVVAKLDQHTAHILRTVPVKWAQCNANVEGGGSAILSPILLSSSRARFSMSHIFAGHLPQEQLAEFSVALEKFCKQLRCTSLESGLVISAPSLVTFDNHSVLHSIRPIVGGRHVFAHEQVTFNLHYPLELYRSLSAASRHPLHRHYVAKFCSRQTLEQIDTEPCMLKNWPLVHKRQYIESMRAVFTELFFGRGSVYWSPSGGSTSSRTSRIALPTAASEMHLMRARLRELYMDKGLISSDTVCANLLGAGNLCTGMEVQCEIMREAGATHLGIGPDVSDEKVCDIIEQYGANLIVTLGSRIMQLIIYCVRNQRKLQTVTRVLHGGENFSDTVAQTFGRVLHRDVQTFAVYGSSEAGVFALKGHNERHYETMLDSLYLEIVDEHGEEVPQGQIGTLVVTNLIRQIHPQVRYFTGDLARLMTTNRSKFDVIGRDLKSIRQRLGSKEVTWEEIVESVGGLLEKTFGGLCIYQIWVEKTTGEDHKLTLAVYAGKLSNEQQEAFMSQATRCLGHVFTPSFNVSELNVRLVDTAQEMHRTPNTSKLRYFVDWTA